MKTQKARPTFKVLHDGTIPVETAGRVYNAKVSEPANWHGLREAKYGNGFEQGTFGENLDFVHSAYLNQEFPEAQGVVGVARKFWVTGDTAILYTPQAIFVQDHPRVENGRIVMDTKKLESKLGSREASGVVFSTDGSVRRIPYGFAREWQNRDQIKSNPFSIALTGDQNAPEKLAEIMGIIDKRGYIWVLDEGTKNEIRVPGLGEGDGGLGLGGFNWVEFYDGGYSFGVRK